MSKLIKMMRAVAISAGVLASLATAAGAETKSECWPSAVLRRP